MPFKFNPLTGSIDSVNSRSEDASFSGNIKMADDKGIDFSAYDGNDTSGTATGNILKDYEEGTFTMTLEGSGVNTTYTATSNQQAKYTKIGNQVTVFAVIDGSMASGASGNLLIKGLPFDSVGEHSAALQYNQISVGLPSNTYVPMVVIQNGNSFCEVRCNKINNSGRLEMQIQNVTYGRFVLTYTAA